ncbi:MAG TPA: zf-HC2 domain-containing protein [Ktedonobacterales bacterium]|jgi:anti-sigma factor RsiW
MTEDINRRLHESPEYRQAQLSAALDGMLAPEEQAALDAHLAECDTCARELEELRQVRRLLRAMPEPALPRSFLLPTEGELAAPRRAERPAGRAPATTPNVTPLRQPTRRPTRTLQVTRWIGTIAAVLGMALFLGTILVHQGASYSMSAPSSAPSSQDGGPNPAVGGGGTANGVTIPSPTHTFANGGTQSTATDKAATATSSPTIPARSSGTPAATQISPSSGPTTGDILRVVALVLLFGGIVVALASFIVARRI